MTMFILDLPWHRKISSTFFLAPANEQKKMKRAEIKWYTFFCTKGRSREILRNAPEKGGRRRKADKSCFRDNVRYSSRRLPAGWETKLQTRQHQAGKEASEWIKVWPMLYRKPSLGDRANSKDLRSWNNCQYTAKKRPPWQGIRN